MYFGYILVLMAMTFAQVSYILSVRQLSIVIGAGLGVMVLGEEHGIFRLVSSAIIFTGVVVIGVMA
jgi:drug/metabolite transporter (DMT)-like permease